MLFEQCVADCPVPQVTRQFPLPMQCTVQSPLHVTSQLLSLLHVTVLAAPTVIVQLDAREQVKSQRSPQVPPQELN